MVRTRRRYGNGPALIASAAAHGLLLLLLMRDMPRLQAFERPPRSVVELQIETLPPLAGIAARRHVMAPAAAEAAVTPRPRAAPPPPPARIRAARGKPAAEPRPVLPLPAAPSPSPAAGVQQERAPVASSRWGLGKGPAADQGTAGLRSTLRTTVGCSHEDFLHLTKAELDACHQQFGAEARKVQGVTVDAIPAAKRAHYDAVRQAYEAVANPAAPLDSRPGAIQLFGCKHGKCGAVLPQGAGTEESGVTPP